MAKAKSKPERPAAKGRTTAKTAARDIVDDRDRVGPRASRPSAKDAVAEAVARPADAKPERPSRAETADAKPAVEKSSSKASDKPAGPRAKPAPTKRTAPPPSARYTPPVPKSQKVSPIWVPILMFACLGLGMLIIILNYVNVLPGNQPSNVYLMMGLGLITVGFVTATKYH